MKLKFIKALLEACETPDEIDEVFDMAEYDLFSDRCLLLEEKGARYFDLPEDTKARMMDAYNQAKASYENAITSSYYFDFSNPNCRQFYKDAALSAGKRGLEMGLRQALGFLFVEMWFSVKDAIAGSDQTFEGVCKATADGLTARLR